MSQLSDVARTEYQRGYAQGKKDAVVHCRECKFHYWEQEPCHGRTEHFCRKLNAEVTRDFYCAAGRRKDAQEGAEHVRV